MPWDQTTHQKSQCRWQRHPLRNDVWASRPQELKNMKVSRPTWFPKDSAGGGVTNRIEERGHPPLDSAGGVYMATLSPKDGREQASKGRFVGLTSAQDASGESSGR